MAWNGCFERLETIHLGHFEWHVVPGSHVIFLLGGFPSNRDPKDDPPTQRQFERPWSLCEALKRPGIQWRKIYIYIDIYWLYIHIYIYNGICIFIFIVYICVWKHQTERVHPENLGYLWKIFLAPAWTPLAQALGESGQVRSCGCGVWWGYWPSLFKPWKGDIF